MQVYESLHKFMRVYPSLLKFTWLYVTLHDLHDLHDLYDFHDLHDIVEYSRVQFCSLSMFWQELSVPDWLTDWLTDYWQHWPLELLLGANKPMLYLKQGQTRVDKCQVYEYIIPRHFFSQPGTVYYIPTSHILGSIWLYQVNKFKLSQLDKLVTFLMDTFLLYPVAKLAQMISSWVKSETTSL